MQQIQLTPEQVKELESMTRLITDVDQAALNQAYAELDKKGFLFSGENFMKLIRAYNSAPQAPITVQNVLDFTTKYHDAFEWLSATELAYNQLTAQIGPDKTAEVAKLLKSHKLNAPPDEGGIDNFVALVRHSQSQGWGLDRNTFHQLINHFQRYVPNTQLYWTPTSSQQAQQKRWEKARAADPPPTIKGLLEAAKQKAASVAHIVNPDGTRMSDQIMRDFFQAHPEAMETEAPAKTPQQKIEDGVEAHWKQQTEDYIRSLSGQNLLQQEAQQKFGQPLHGSWRQAYNALQIWHERKKLGVWGQQ